MNEKTNFLNSVSPDTKDEDFKPGDYATFQKDNETLWVKYLEGGSIKTFQVGGIDCARTTFNVNEKIIDFGYVDFNMVQKLNSLHNASAKMGYRQALIDMKAVIDSMLEKFQ